MPPWFRKKKHLTERSSRRSQIITTWGDTFTNTDSFCFLISSLLEQVQMFLFVVSASGPGLCCVLLRHFNTFNSDKAKMLIIIIIIQKKKFNNFQQWSKKMLHVKWIYSKYLKNWLTWLPFFNHLALERLQGPPAAPCSTNNHRWLSPSVFMCVVRHWSMFTSDRFVHVHFEWNCQQIGFYSLKQTKQGMFQINVILSNKKKIKGPQWCLYISDPFLTWTRFCIVCQPPVDPIVCTDDCLQSYSRVMVLSTLWPSSPTTLQLRRSFYFLKKGGTLV